MISYRKAREFALQSLYALEIGQHDKNYFTEDLAGIIEVDNQMKIFGRELIHQTVENILEIDKLITESALNWDFDRLPVLDRIILRFSLAEIIYMKKTPPKVCITEAVQLAKKYSDTDSPKFVNGVLDNICKKLSLINNKA